MNPIKSLDDLRKMREALQSKLSLRERSDRSETLIQIKVSMATCGIASGAKEIMALLIDELDRHQVEAIVTQTGCMGYCYAEPTLEIQLPGQQPIVFGYVNAAKATELVERYILQGELVDGIIPVNYQTIYDKA